jgi:putative hydrolase of the HAD superfamily
VTAFDAVVFDLDNTLCRHAGDLDAAYRQAFETVDGEPFGAPAELWAALDGPPDPSDQVGYLGAGFARVAAQHGRPAVDPLELAAGLVEAIDTAAVEFLPGAEAALATAGSVGPVGILTNGPADRQTSKVRALDLESQVEAIVYAGDLPRRKPHVGPFESILGTLDSRADRTLYVGDSLKFDVAGAHNAGLPVAWLREDGTEAGQYRPEYVLDSLDDLEAVLDA